MRRKPKLAPVEPKMNARIRRGTTLIELLVVVTVIAILVAALIPSLRRSLTMARSTVCMHNLHMLSHGLAQYQYENDGWLPTDGIAPDAATPSEVWFVKLYPAYLPDPMLLTCPEDPFKHRMATVQDIRRVPNVANYSSYGINGFLLTGAEGQLADLSRREPSRPLDVILAADIGPDQIASGGGNAGEIAGPDRNASMLALDDGFDPFMPDQPSPNPWITTRHSGRINMLTITGGVRMARTAEALQGPVQRYYSSCANAGCTLCNQLHLYHYTFVRDGLFWWTGQIE
jgi:prepilin-type N-terminal cleavage/methylation domain-containing protein